MNPKQLTFQSQKLVVDYISFNIQGLIDPKPIANYLFQNFGFNYTIEKKSNGKRESQSSNSARQNQFKVSFRQYEYNPEAKSFWLGTKIDFSGKNATRFYQLIQQQKINWNILQLSNLSISRFDVCYFREKRLTDQKGQPEQRSQGEARRIPCASYPWDVPKRCWPQHAGDARERQSWLTRAEWEDWSELARARRNQMKHE